MAVISGSRVGLVSFLWQHGVCQLGPRGCAGAPCPSLHPSGGKYSSLLPCRKPDTPVRVSRREFRRGKKDSSLPQKPSAFPAAQASPPCLGCALASEGDLNPPCHQSAADPGLRGRLRLLQNWQPPGVSSPAHICSGTPSSAVASLAQKLLLAKWLQPGILAYL